MSPDLSREQVDDQRLVCTSAFIRYTPQWKGHTSQLSLSSAEILHFKCGGMVFWSIIIDVAPNNPPLNVFVNYFKCKWYLISSIRKLRIVLNIKHASAPF